MTQLLLPAATVSNAWTVVGAATAHEALQVADQLTARVETNSDGFRCTVRVDTPDVPASSSGWTVHCEYRLSGAMIAAYGGQVGAKLLVRLLEGVNVKWEWAPPMFADTVWRTFSDVLPASVAATITVLADLRLQVEDGLSQQGTFGSKHQVSYLALEVPDGDSRITGGYGAPGVKASASALAPQAVHAQAVWP